MSDHYVLNDDRTVRKAELIEWAIMFEDISKRRVASDEIDGVRISTVFLGLDHSFGGGLPLLFETLIFGGPLDQKMWRYSTWNEAVAGHEQAMTAVKNAASGTPNSRRPA